MELIEQRSLSTAAQIVALLHAEGVAATQATITRDLQELGAIKVRDNSGARRFTLPPQPRVGPAPLEHLKRMMGEWAVAVDFAGHLVVVRTPPGCAHVVASALDRSALPSILGTVAGDDTILVIAREEVGGAALRDDLAELAGLHNNKGSK
jgi:transcriptional regulator of arginine metabolism